MDHTYEELRDVVVDILLRREAVTYPPEQWGSLTSGVAEVIQRRALAGAPMPQGMPRRPMLTPNDAELVRDVFWDLFRQGYITLGLNDGNAAWPFFRLSRFGEKALATGTLNRFHDTTTFLRIVRDRVPDLSEEALRYVDEAVASFYAGCLLASSVMLGVAAEAEFIRLTEVANASPTRGAAFADAVKERNIKTKITAFNKALEPIRKSLEPRKAFEDLDTNLAQIQAVIRTARNDAGHPTGAPPPSREQSYVNLQMFIPLARQMMALRQFFAK